MRDLSYWVGKLSHSAHCISHVWVSEVQALEMRCIGVSFPRADGIPLAGAPEG